MKSTIFKRTLGTLISVFLLCASVPAQLALGPQRLISVSAPTLRNRTSLRTGLRSGRPRLSFVGRVGGVAFDGVASPAKGLKTNSLALNYSSAQRDGERLSVTINGQSVLAPIYDWQLIPIAKFADSPFYSCFTLFGDLKDAERQKTVLKRRGRVLNYHPNFRNTLMGLRLFQLDSLIINEYSYDLVKDGDAYILGEGETAPNIQDNENGLKAFQEYRKQNAKLFDSATSYVISDNRRRIIFDVQGNELIIQGEPSYYFWVMDKEAFLKFYTGEAKAQVYKKLLVQIQEFRRGNPEASGSAWLINQLLVEALGYDKLIGNYRIVEALGYSELLELLSTNGQASREALLSQQSPETLLQQLVDLRTVASIQSAKEVVELSEKLSSETGMLRAINPTVWDAGVNLLRYAAFFRYCKAKNPQQWRLFMRQIKRAPAPQPSVTTPTIMERPSR